MVRTKITRDGTRPDRRRDLLVNDSGEWQDQSMYPGPPSPAAPKPGSNRVVAGLAWLVAGGIAIAATFFDIYRLRNSSAEFLQGFWYQRFVNGGEGLRTAQVWLGVNVFVGVAAILVATLLVFVSRQRRGVMVTASFGIGMLFADVLRWSLFFLPTPLDQTRTPELGFWLLVVAVVVSLVALVFVLVARVQPAAPVGYPPSPQPPRWEPQTPRYGVPVQQPPSQPRPPAQLAQPDRTASVDQPKPATAPPDTSAHKPEGGLD